VSARRQPAAAAGDVAASLGPVLRACAEAVGDERLARRAEAFERGDFAGGREDAAVMADAAANIVPMRDGFVAAVFASAARAAASAGRGDPASVVAWHEQRCREAALDAAHLLAEPGAVRAACEASSARGARRAGPG